MSQILSPEARERRQSPLPLSSRQYALLSRLPSDRSVYSLSLSLSRSRESKSC